MTKTLEERVVDLETVVGGVLLEREAAQADTPDAPSAGVLEAQHRAFAARVKARRGGA